LSASELAERNCIPCRGGVPPMERAEAESLLSRLAAGWQLVEVDPGVTALRKSFQFKDFGGALAFVNAAGAIAEEQGHHPDMLLRWGEVRVDIWTHKIKGLTESDFILAAKFDRI
jgi:4a-hydroxytetrahydrobiopterin dehydratase